jgi:hypothetical protein
MTSALARIAAPAAIDRLSGLALRSVADRHAARFAGRERPTAGAQHDDQREDSNPGHGASVSRLASSLIVHTSTVFFLASCVSAKTGEHFSRDFAGRAA